MEIGERVMFVTWDESDVVMKGRISNIRELQSGDTYTITGDIGGTYKIPKMFILKKITRV